VTTFADLDVALQERGVDTHRLSALRRSLIARSWPFADVPTIQDDSEWEAGPGPWLDQLADRLQAEGYSNVHHRRMQHARRLLNEHGCNGFGPRPEDLAQHPLALITVTDIGERYVYGVDDEADIARTAAIALREETAEAPEQVISLDDGSEYRPREHFDHGTAVLYAGHYAFEGPDALEALYAAANARERGVLEQIAVRAGLRWVCPVRPWTNTTGVCCGDCGRTQAEATALAQAEAVPHPQAA
jgi:hypothetical protein